MYIYNGDTLKHYKDTGNFKADFTLYVEEW